MTFSSAPSVYLLNLKPPKGAAVLATGAEKRFVEGALIAGAAATAAAPVDTLPGRRVSLAISRNDFGVSLTRPLLLRLSVFRTLTLVWNGSESSS